MPHSNLTIQMLPALVVVAKVFRWLTPNKYPEKLGKFSTPTKLYALFYPDERKTPPL
jgi:hypothetical protein